MEVSGLKIRRGCRKMGEIGGDGLARDRLGGRGSLGIACGFIEGGTGQVVAQLAEIPRGVLIGKSGFAQNSNDAVDKGDAGGGVEPVHGKERKELRVL